MQLQSAYQDKEEENVRLKTYIDTILLNIVENYPQLLEVKNLGGKWSLKTCRSSTSKYGCIKLKRKNRIQNLLEIFI